MKKKLLILFTALTIIAGSFTGCRTAGNVASKVESDGRTVGSQIGGAVPDTVSKVESGGRVISGTVSQAVSGITSR